MWTHEDGCYPVPLTSSTLNIKERLTITMLFTLFCCFSETMDQKIPYDDYQLPVVFLPSYENPPAWIPPQEVCHILVEPHFVPKPICNFDRLLLGLLAFLKLLTASSGLHQGMDTQLSSQELVWNLGHMSIWGEITTPCCCVEAPSGVWCEWPLWSLAGWLLWLLFPSMFWSVLVLTSWCSLFPTCSWNLYKKHKVVWVQINQLIFFNQLFPRFPI